MSVFGHCASGNGIAFFVQYIGQFIIVIRLFLVFVVYAILQDTLYLADGVFFTAFGSISIVEEESERVNSIVGLYIFAVAYP